MAPASLTFSRSGQRLHALDIEKGGLKIWRLEQGNGRDEADGDDQAAPAKRAMHIESHD